MNQEHQWNLPAKRKGSSLKNIHHKLDPDYIAALDRLAGSETRRTGKTISRGTIITDLSTKDSVFHRQMRAELRRAYLQIKRDNNNEHTTVRKSGSTQAE